MSDKDHSLRLTIDPKGAETGSKGAVSAAQRAQKAAEKATKAFDKLNEAINLGSGQGTKLPVAATDKFTAALQRQQKTIDALQSKINTLNNKLDRYSAKAGTAKKRTVTLAHEIRGLGITLAGLGFGALNLELLQFIDSFTVLQNRVAVVTGSSEGLNQVTRELLDVSINARTELDATVDVYSKLVRANDQYGLSQKELLTVTETVSKAVSMSGASAQGAQGALMQFGQAIAGNFKASAQELNSIIEQTPGLSKVVADALTSTNELGKVAVSDLKRLAADGAFSAEQVLRGILNISDAVDKDFQAATITMQQGWLTVTDALRVYLGEADKAVGFSKSIAEGLQDLAKNLDEYESIIYGLGAAFTALSVAAAAALAVFLGTPGLIAGAVATITGTLVAGGVEFYKYGEAIEEAGEYADEAAPLVHKLAVAWKELIDLITGQNEEDELEQMARGFAKLDLPDLRDALDETAKKLADKAREAAAFKLKYWGDLLEITKLGESDAAQREVDQLTKKMHALNLAFNMATDISDDVGDSLDRTGTDAAKLSLIVGEMTENTLTRSEKAWNKYQERLSSIRKLGVDSTEKKEAEALAWEEYQKALSKTNRSTKVYEETSQDLTKQLQKELDTIGMTERELRKYEAELTLNNAALKDGIALKQADVEAALKQIDAIYDAKDALEAKTEADKKAEEAAKEHEKAQEELAETIADTFMDALDAAMDGMDSFKDFFKDWLKDLAMQAIRNQIMIPISAGVSGGGGVGSTAPSLSGSLGGIKGIADFFNPSSGSVVTTINQTAADLGYGFAADGMGPPTALIDSSSMLGQGLNAIGPGLSAYTMAQQYGPIGGIVGGAGSVALAGGVSGAITAGSIGGFGAGAMSALASMGPMGWATIAIGTILGMSGGGETRAGGRYVYGDILPELERLEGSEFARQKVSSGGAIAEDYTVDLMEGTVDYINSTLERAGSALTVSGFVGRYTTSENSRGGVYTGGTLDGGIAFGERDYEEGTSRSLDPEEAVKAFTEDLKQVTLQALQAADLGDEIGEFLTSLGDIEKLSASQTESAMMFVEQMLAHQEMITAFGEALEELPFENLKNLTEDMTKSLVESAGGLEQMLSGLNAYYDLVYTEQEKFDQTTKDLTKAFEEINIELPKSKEEFRQVVESIDVTTEAGQELYTSLLNLVPAFGQYVSDFESMNSTLERESLSNFLDSLQLSEFSALSLEDKYTESADVYSETLQKALMGDIDAIKNLEDVSSQYLEFARETASSDEEYDRTFGRVVAGVSSVLGVDSSSGTVVESYTTPLSESTQEVAENSSAQNEEMKTLIEELKGLRIEMLTNVENTNKTSKILDRITPDGESLQVTVLS